MEEELLTMGVSEMMGKIMGKLGLTWIQSELMGI